MSDISGYTARINAVIAVNSSSLLRSDRRFAVSSGLSLNWAGKNATRVMFFAGLNVILLSLTIGRLFDVPDVSDHRNSIGTDRMIPDPVSNSSMGRLTSSSPTKEIVNERGRGELSPKTIFTGLD